MVRTRRSNCLSRHLRYRLGVVENVRYALLRCTFTVACGVVAYLVLVADTFWFLYNDILCKMNSKSSMCLELHIAFTTIMPMCHKFCIYNSSAIDIHAFQDRSLDRVVRVPAVFRSSHHSQGCPLGPGAFVSALQNTWASR
jgi:hypothetical protein